MLSANEWELGQLSKLLRFLDRFDPNGEFVESVQLTAAAARIEWDGGPEQFMLKAGGE